MLAGPASPGLLFLSKMDFHRPHVSQKSSNDNATDLQDVSSLAFFAKHRLVNRLFRIRNVFLGSIFDDFDFLTKQLKQLIFLIF